MGTVVRIPGIKRQRNKKTGRWYCYHRATNTPITEEFGSGAFFVALARIEAEHKQKKVGGANPGTLRALILSYKVSERFTDLALRTKRDYEKVFSYLEPLYDALLAEFTTEVLIDLRKEWRKERGRRFVDYCRTVLQILLKYAVSEKLIKTNPMLEVEPIGRDKRLTAMNRPWTPDEIEAVWEEAPPHLKLPFAIDSRLACAKAMLLPFAGMPSKPDGFAFQLRSGVCGSTFQFLVKSPMPWQNSSLTMRSHFALPQKESPGAKAAFSQHG